MPTLKPRNDLATHASTVALTPARALTSYLRWLYSARYEGKVTNPVRAFTFDLSMVAVIVAFAIGGLYVWLRPAPDSQLWKLSVRAGVLRSLEPSAIETNVTWSGDRNQQNVRLQWEVPAGTTILSSDRTIDQNGYVDLGTLKKGETVTSRIVARFYLPNGEAALRFRVFYDQGILAGTETRTIEGSAVALSPLVATDQLAANAVIPFVLESSTTMPIEGLRLTSANGHWFNGDAFTGLASNERRIVFFAPSSSNAEVGMLAHATPVLTQKLSWAAAASRAITVNRLSSHDSSLSIDVTALQPGELLVFHPAFEQGFVRQAVFAGQQTITIPFNSKTLADEWSVIPIWKAGDKTVLGDWSRAAITAPVSLEASIRYFATSGDQLGVGPLPPKIGQPTRYWLQWRLAPRTDDAKDLIVKATLPQGLHWTGNSALPIGGEVTEENGELIWKLSQWPAQIDGIANVELEFTPTAAMKGITPYLLGESTVEATDARTFETIKTTHPALDASLPEDERARGNGIVQN
ncbi:MAG: hypothetical protein U0487_00985 [Patescibacteria group bacterium]